MPTSLPDRDHLLVVEDDAAQRVGLQQLLKSWGYAVDVASDGREALEKVAALRPTIVLSDLVMPHMGGLELLRSLQADDDGDVTVVLMTAQGTVETAVEAIKAGRVRLPHQADRSAAAEDPARPDRRPERPAARGAARCAASCRNAARSAG